MTPSQEHRKKEGLGFTGSQPAVIRLRRTVWGPDTSDVRDLAFDYFDPVGVPIVHAGAALYNHFMSMHAGDPHMFGQVLYFPPLDVAGRDMEKWEHLAFSGNTPPTNWTVSMQAFNPLSHARVVGNGFSHPVDFSALNASISKRFRDARYTP